MVDLRLIRVRVVVGKARGMPSPDQWPEDIVAQPSKQSESEVKLVNNLFAAAVEVKDEVDELLQKHTFWESVRILGWITRFVK